MLNTEYAYAWDEMNKSFWLFHKKALQTFRPNSRNQRDTKMYSNQKPTHWLSENI